MGLFMSKTHLPFPKTSPCFYVSAGQVFLKTQMENEKSLIMSKFSFFNGVFYPFGELSAIVINLNLLFANSFSLEESKICCLRKG